MRDYAELIKAPRTCVMTIPCTECPYYGGNEQTAECKTMNIAAADAIEELLAELVTIRNQLPQQTVETNLFDQEERHTNCTVQILRNSVTGEVSVGWWENDNKPIGTKEGN